MMFHISMGQKKQEKYLAAGFDLYFRHPKRLQRAGEFIIQEVVLSDEDDMPLTDDVEEKLEAVIDRVIDTLRTGITEADPEDGLDENEADGLKFGIILGLGMAGMIHAQEAAAERQVTVTVSFPKS
jgi:hypothetical protein